VRPLDPDLRRKIIEDLLGLNERGTAPLWELVDNLKQQYDSTGHGEISKKQSRDVATALTRCGVCERRPWDHHPDGTWFLRSRVDPDQALRQCSMLYLWHLLRHPAWSRTRRLSTQGVVSILRWGVENGTFDGLLEAMAAHGVCRAEGEDWVALGDHFLEGFKGA